MTNTASKNNTTNRSAGAAETTFIDGNERLARLRADPERAKRVKAIREDGREMDRIDARLSA